jgi:NAD(P)-dependent dehydrogenase (short-subunit alcohol dehydrogenase family)
MGHKYAARQFIAQGTGGAIISTSSIAGLEGGWGGSMYTIAKHAVIGVVRAAVNDLSSYGIRSNAIAPGIVAAPSIASTFGVPTAEAEAFTEFLDDRLTSTQPLGRMGRGIDIASAAVYLASDLAKFVTGVVLPVDGGATAVTLTPAFQVAGQASQNWAAGAR